MLRKLSSRLLAVTLTGALLSACTTATPPRDAATANLAMRPTSNDVCFVQMMLPHHQQALEMSETLLSKDGVWERGRRFAQYVLASQGEEVVTMQAWLDAWDTALAQGSATSSQTAAGHGAHAGHGTATGAGAPTSGADTSLPGCSHHHDAMPGMLTAEQLDDLRDAEGAQAQRLYLELMIPHHQGALAMAEDALRLAENDYVKASAAHVLQEQTSEIASLEAMIRALDSGDLDLAPGYADSPYRTSTSAR